MSLYRAGVGVVCAVLLLVCAPVAHAEIATSTAETIAAEAFKPADDAFGALLVVDYNGKPWFMVYYYRNDIEAKKWFYLGRVVIDGLSGKVVSVDPFSKGIPNDEYWQAAPVTFADETTGETGFLVTEDDALAIAASAYELPPEYSVYKRALLPGETQMYYVFDFVRYDSYSQKTYWGLRAVVDPYSGEVVQDPEVLRVMQARSLDIPEEFDPRTKELVAGKKSITSDIKNLFQSPRNLALIIIFILVLIGLPLLLIRSGYKIPTRKVLDVSFGAATLIQLVLAVYFIRYGDSQSLASLWLFISAMGTITSWISTRFFMQQQSFGDDKKNFKPMSAGDVKKLTWSDLIIDPGTLTELKRVVSLIENPDALTQLGVDPPKGILLYGPPGTGKTTIAKVLANEAKATFFSISIAEVYTMWFGQSQQRIHELFEEARKHKPSIIFIDEIDSLMSRRGRSATGYEDTITNQVLQEIDGIRDSNYVFVVGATNAPDAIDSALLRGGRLSTQIEIPSPGPVERAKLFTLFLKKTPIDSDVSVDALAAKTEGYSGADIKDICERAILMEFDQHKSTTLRLSQSDILAAIEGYSRNSRVYKVPEYFKKDTQA